MIVTKAWINANRTPTGVFTASQIAALGLAFPLTRGWIDGCVGMAISETAARAFEGGRLAPPKKKRRPYPELRSIPFAQEKEGLRPSEPSSDSDGYCRIPLTREQVSQMAAMDAAVWAAEFCKRNTASDESTMLGWFANAIMAGFDEASRRYREDAEKWLSSQASKETT